MCKIQVSVVIVEPLENMFWGRKYLFWVLKTLPDTSDTLIWHLEQLWKNRPKSWFRLIFYCTFPFWRPLGPKIRVLTILKIFRKCRTASGRCSSAIISSEMCSGTLSWPGNIISWPQTKILDLCGPTQKMGRWIENGGGYKKFPNSSDNDHLLRKG